LLRAVQPLIAQSLKNIRAYDGQRLPADDWHIVRSIMLERDGHACVYCGANKPLEGDHIVPLSQGGSNDLTNLATACRTCNLSKASSMLEEWHARRAAAVPKKRGIRRRTIR
jgi:5-methylcytosine-specific restriction endonuclease McrA